MSAQRDASKQDQRARRCVALLLYLADHPRATVHDIIRCLEEYSDLGSVKSAEHIVLRDAADLGDMGVFVTDDPRLGKILGMSLSTYADLSKLVGPADTVRLSLMLSALLSDQTFLQANELRRALAKILGHVGPSNVPNPIQNDTTPERYLRLIDDRRVSHLKYQDAEGSVSERVVCPLGLFELNGHTYLVADTLSSDKAKSSRQRDAHAAIRVYRDDRILALSAASTAEARQFGKTFEIPPDFNASDWCVLPFQIGEQIGPVEFVLDDSRRRDVEARLQNAREHRWTLFRLEDGGWHLKVDVCCSWEDAARWAIGMDLTPVAPVEVVDSWKALLRQARTGLLSLAPLASERVVKSSSRHKGRPLSTPVIAQLLGLLSLFSEPGCDVSTAEIAHTLGVSPRRARELVDLLSQTSLTYGYVPVEEGSAPDTWRLSEWSDYRAQRLRLTRREAEAVESAVERCGLTKDAREGYRRLRAAFWPVEHSFSITEQHDAGMGERWARRMLVIADALAEEKSIRFGYQGLHDDAPQVRHALPRVLFSRNRTPYVSAFDLARNEIRQFHLGRMTSLEVEESTPGERAAAERAEGPVWFSDVNRVVVSLGDPRATSFFNWEGLVELEQSDEQTKLILVPDLGDEWLARHVAAWADVAKTDDLGLSRRVSNWARNRLG